MLGSEDIAADKNIGYHALEADYGVKRLSGLDGILPADHEAQFTMLELGAGAGHVSGWVKSEYGNARVIASDLIDRCLEITKSNYPDVETVKCDADGEIPFPEKSMDFVVSSNLFEHLEDDRRHLAQVWQVLKPGGAYFIATPHLAFDTFWFGVIDPSEGIGRWRAVWGRLTRDRRVSHCNLQTPGSLRRRLRIAGYSVDMRRREAMSSNERDKISFALRWLPGGWRDRLVRAIERVWLSVPPQLQPTLTVVARKPDHGAGSGGP